MPIYLSLPGHATKEPWRKYLNVYERPFPLNLGGDDTQQQPPPPLRPQVMRHTSTAMSLRSQSSSSAEEINNRPSAADEKTTTHQSAAVDHSSSSADGNKKISSSNNPPFIRRIRHAEVVLVDQCVIAYGRYWLRLKWPGEQGGHGGYVALSKVDDVATDGHGGDENDNYNDGGGEDHITGDESSDELLKDGVNNNNNTASSSLHQTTPLGIASLTITPTSLLCPQTNLHYPTSGAMKLLQSYDDGLNNDNDDDRGLLDNNDEILVSLETGEPVFCRICREGLHDVNTDYLETAAPPQQSSSSSSSTRVANNNAALEDDADEGSRERDMVATSAAAEAALGTSTTDTATANTTTMRNNSEERNAAEERSLSPISASGGEVNNKFVVPSIMKSHPSIENPLLAPCKCTGSMAFVHYLCIEQWRCRSRHPGAKNGLNCETCGSEYTLPPPPSRPNRNPAGVDGGVMVGDDDWLDAMPPHVLAALRRPHPWWQLGAAVVRRRWLRPFVPVLASPLVALYCKARRTLKKRGVSRRRWACSLCRRRARWKCVRCLRSYYCSRQCQNVSWHIVHKHVCYKPVRFWWSVVVYTLGTLILVPGIIKNFPIYDTSFTLLPINFVTMGNIAGGLASTLKRSAGIDIRGRILEISVIICTLFLTTVTSGIIRGFFGDSSYCWGVLASSTSWSESATQAFTDSASNKVLSTMLRFAQLYYQKWDFICARTGFVSRKFLCTPTDDGNVDYATIGCSPPVRNINTEFYLEEEKCRADIGMVGGLWVASCLVLFLEHVYREYRVRRRAAVHRGRRRPHQD